MLITLNRPNALERDEPGHDERTRRGAGGSRKRSRRFARWSSPARAARFPPAKISAATSRKPRGPTASRTNTSLNATYNKFRDADRKDILGRQLYRWQYPKPIIGAVSGWCLGAASWLALTCHITIAADDAVFGQPQVRHGANTDFIWVALAGFKNALRYSLTGDHVDAQEALRIGLVNQVVPKDQLLETCFQVRRARRARTRRRR